MPEPKALNPFDLLVEQIRVVVREEITAALNSNGNGHGALLTAEELAKKLQVSKATIYEWVKSNSIPCRQSGRFLRFDLHEVLESQRKKNGNPS